jgi:hypothetical protein
MDLLPWTKRKHEQPQTGNLKRATSNGQPQAAAASLRSASAVSSRYRRCMCEGSMTTPGEFVVEKAFVE